MDFTEQLYIIIIIQDVLLVTRLPVKLHEINSNIMFYINHRILWSILVNYNYNTPSLLLLHSSSVLSQYPAGHEAGLSIISYYVILFSAGIGNQISENGSFSISQFFKSHNFSHPASSGSLRGSASGSQLNPPPLPAHQGESAPSSLLLCRLILV